MILLYVGFGVALAALVALVLVVKPKLPTLLTMDPGKLPKHQTAERKRKILEDRLDRRVKHLETRVVALAKPMVGRIREWYTSAVDRTHQKVTATAGPQPAPTVESALTVSDLLVQAGEEAKNDRWEALEATGLAIVKVDPTNLDAYRYLGRSYLEREQWDEAGEVFTYLSKRALADPMVLEGLGRVAVTKGRREEAEAAYARVIDQEPEEPEHRLALAEARIAFGDGLGAFEAAADALRLASSNPRVIDHYIRVALAANKPGFAEDGVVRLEYVNPENGKIAEYRALIAKEVDQLPKRRRR